MPSASPSRPWQVIAVDSQSLRARSLAAALSSRPPAHGYTLVVLRALVHSTHAGGQSARLPLGRSAGAHRLLGSASRTWQSDDSQEELSDRGESR